MAMCVPVASPSELPVPAMPGTAWKCLAAWRGTGEQQCIPVPPCTALHCPAVSSSALQPAHSWHHCPGGDTEAPHRQAMATHVTPHRSHLCSSTYPKREATPDSATCAAEKMHSRNIFCLGYCSHVASGSQPRGHSSL